MTRPPLLSTYDDDFFAWTQEQATALREIPREMVGAHVDIDHVAEEIEDLGKRDLREVSSYLTRLMEHLIKINASGDSRNRPHWASETIHFQQSAVAAFTPSMRQLLDMEKIWRNGRRIAREYLQDVGSPGAVPTTCPYVLDELISDDFDVGAALAKLGVSRATGGQP